MRMRNKINPPIFGISTEISRISRKISGFQRRFHGFHERFQDFSGDFTDFTNFTKDFRISTKISGFRERFQISREISGKVTRFRGVADPSAPAATQAGPPTTSISTPISAPRSSENTFEQQQPPTGITLPAIVTAPQWPVPDQDPRSLEPLNFCWGEHSGQAMYDVINSSYEEVIH